ncbi:MAG TPA: NADH-quinone oxidoreductase subunit J, partial [Elusimicrobia bacterium]|nr:NADH-quinone oxidoreductase subunit J [Elusimicrobiota bacterium]
ALPFEAVSLVLIAALVGAVVFSKRLTGGTP